VARVYGLSGWFRALWVRCCTGCLLLLLPLCGFSQSNPYFTISNATAFSGSVPAGQFPTAGMACDQYVANAAAAITNQGGCTGATSVGLTACPQPSLPSLSTGTETASAQGGISYSWIGRQYGNPGDACVGFSATGTFKVNETYTVPPPTAGGCAALAGHTDYWHSQYGAPNDLSAQQLCDTQQSSGNATQPGCLVNYKPDMGYWVTGSGQYSSTVGGTSTFQTSGVGTYTGGSCAPGPGVGSVVSGAPTPSTASEDGPVSKCDGFEGTLMGATVCVPRVGPNGVDSTVTKSSTSGTTTVANPDGTSTTQGTQNTTSTNCSKDSTGTVMCVTATSTTVTQGTSTTTTTGTQTASLSDFCKSNPKDKNCVGLSDSSFAGNCGAPPACTGDAVECAIAGATFQANCALNPQDTGGEQALYAQSKGTGTGLGTTSVAISSSSFDTSDALGGGGLGLTDKSYTLNLGAINSSFTVPFSMLNPWLSALGNILVAGSFLIALGIVGKGVN
jgi:hypothetical protein